jgi:mercuric reductase
MTGCCAAAGSGAVCHDLVVVGAGSAGFAAAIAAVEAGARVALIGEGTIGGTCVNVGCVPSKALIRAVGAVHEARRAATRFAGVESTARIADWTALMAQKDALVAALRQAKYADLLRAYDRITYIEGRARLVPGGVLVGDRRLPAERIVLATGARPALPDIPGIAAVAPLDSTAALELGRLPRSLLVLGAGYVGVELAQTFARAGVEVTLLCRSRPLPEAEPEISAALARYLADEGIRVLGGLRYERLAPAKPGVALTVTAGDRRETLFAERLLVATGRRPNSEGLGLAEAGVAVAPDGAILVDAHMRTSARGIYAAGDVTGRDPFVYMAAYGGRLAALNALQGDRLRYDASAMPAVVFSDPQAASVGLTEARAQALGHAVRSSVLALDEVPRALVAHDTRGLIKLVADARTGRLLGAHILAPEGADAIQTAAMAIRGGLTVADLAATIFPYLTTVEGLKLAALAFEKDVSRLSCCAG